MPSDRWKRWWHVYKPAVYALGALLLILLGALLAVVL
jgi:hypothetical protein